MACFILLRRETEDRCDKIIKTASVRWLYYSLIHSLARRHTRTCAVMGWYLSLGGERGGSECADTSSVFL